MKVSYIKLAWRNLWRNKRRTAITTASILFAVFFALFMRSFQLGFYDHMIKNAIENFSGFIQVQHEDFIDDPSMNNVFEYDPLVLEKLRNMEGVKAVVPRVEGGGMGSSGDLTKPVIVMGIDPVQEQRLSNPAHFIVKYRITDIVINRLKKHPGIDPKVKENLSHIENRSYTSLGGMAIDLDVSEKKFNKSLKIIGEISKIPGEPLIEGDDGVLISDNLARYLKLDIDSTLLIIGIGFEDRPAEGAYIVKGIVKLPSPDLNNKLVFMDIDKAQKLFWLNVEGKKRITTLALNLDDNSEKNMRLFQDKIKAEMNDPNTVVRNWKEYNPVLQQQIESDNKSGQIFMALLYFIIFFGILGTVMMMIHERRREFGVLIAIGMQRTRIAITFVYEMILMGLLGVMTGIVISLPFLYYFHVNPFRLRGNLEQMMTDYGFEPVMPLMWIDTYILWQAIIVALMVVMSCIYPLRKVYKLKAIDAIRS